MGKFKDLTGQKFGKLTVIEQCENIGKNIVWKCTCSCDGKEVKVKSWNLLGGDTKSCGCLKKENGSKRRKDLTGKKIGRWTVIKRAGVRGTQNKATYLCKCSCEKGTEKIIIGETLVSGVSKSCGCYKSEKTIENSRKDIIGKKFKELTVEKYAYTKNKRAYWVCECSCTKKCIKNGYLLTSGQIKNCGRCNLLKEKRPELFDELCIEENIKNGIILDDLTIGTCKKVWWKCEKGHIYECSVKARTRPKNNSNCSICRQSKGNKRIRKFVIKNNVIFEQEKRIKECRDKYPLSFDFYFPNHNLLVEYQGEQHYTLGRYKDCEEKFEGIKKRDQIKRDFCEKEGIKLLEIPYWDFNRIEEILEKELRLNAI